MEDLADIGGIFVLHSRNFENGTNFSYVATVIKSVQILSLSSPGTRLTFVSFHWKPRFTWMNQKPGPAVFFAEFDASFEIVFPPV